MKEGGRKAIEEKVLLLLSLPLLPLSSPFDEASETTSEVEGVDLLCDFASSRCWRPSLPRPMFSCGLFVLG